MPLPRRAHPAPHIEPLPPSLAASAAAARVLKISLRLRARADWRITGADFSRRWTIRLDGERYEVHAAISAFFGGPKPPGFVFGVYIRSFRSKRPCGERIRSTPWFRSLRERLGDAYDDGPLDEQVHTARVVRGTTESSSILRELRHLAHAVEGRPLRRRPSLVPDVGRDAPDDLWRLVERLDGSDWMVSGLSQRLCRRIRRDGVQWDADAGFQAMVDSRKGPPCFSGSVFCFSRRATDGNPINRADDLLRGAGYRFLEEGYRDRWQYGLNGRAADKEILLLEEALERMRA